MDLNNFKNFKLFHGKTLLCIDYGNKITGLAIFTPGVSPMPMSAGRIVYKDDAHLVNEIKKLIDQEVVDEVIIGLPIRSDGCESEQTQKVKKFAELLQQNCQLPLHFQDEHLSTQAAKDRMLNSPQYDFKVQMNKIDEVSAIIILEDFIRASGI